MAPWAAALLVLARLAAPHLAAATADGAVACQDAGGSAAGRCPTPQEQPGDVDSVLLQIFQYRRAAPRGEADPLPEPAGGDGAGYTEHDQEPPIDDAPVNQSGGDPLPAPVVNQSSSEPEPVAEGLVWGDEFDGGAVNRGKWGFDIGGGGWGNQELQYYTDRRANAEVGGGTLQIRAVCEAYAGSHFTSAKLKSKGAWGPGHRIEVRARLPTGKGSWPAFWMLPKESAYGPWPKSGEIDIMEAIGCDPNVAYGTIHTAAFNHLIGTQKQGHINLGVAGWHTYAIDWQAGQIRWSVDGVTYFTFAKESDDFAKWPFNKEFYLILNVAVGGSWSSHCLNGWPSCQAASEFGTAQVMQVDYVRVYAN